MCTAARCGAAALALGGWVSTLAAAAAITTAPGASSPGIGRYGHAFSRPNDFTPAQYHAVAATFSVFTVEKAHAANVYGNLSAHSRAPFRTNSIAATVGTAKKIHALNRSTKVLMYWNSALHYNFYECESEVEPGWFYASPHAPAPFWNYSVPAFRKWWVSCAVDAVRGSNGELDGLFLDGNPKLERPGYVPLWGAMVDELRAALPDAILIDNGYYIGKSGAEDAGEDCWSHTGNTYVESMSNAGLPATGSGVGPEVDLKHLRWLANASAVHPDRIMIGHGSTASTASFRFGMAAWLLVVADPTKSYFLGNDGYSIDGGLLDQPEAVYRLAEACGKPTGSLERVGTTMAVFREYEHGTVRLDLAKGQAAGASICDE